MSNLEVQRSIRENYLVLDGGLGTLLQTLKYDIYNDPLWSAKLLQTNPEAIQKAHTIYLEAGADIITTASYQASIDGFERHSGLHSTKAHQLIRKSVQLALQSVDKYKAIHKTDRRVYIAGSVGPYGACLCDRSEYTGSYMSTISTADLIAWHRPRIQILVENGVDLLAIETFPSLQEALLVLGICREFPSTRAWVSFSCRNGHETNYGDNFARAARQCYEQFSDQLVAVGVNCTPLPFINSLMESMERQLPPANVLPRIVYPNLESSNSSYASDYIDEVAHLAKDMGCHIIGGCCHVSPEHINSISNIIRNINI